jgi:hypothetical protein
MTSSDVTPAARAAVRPDILTFFPERRGWQEKRVVGGEKPLSIV